MKGIKRLYFGLILLALFGVGFKTEAKAEVSAGLEGCDITDWGADSAVENTAFTGTLTINAGNGSTDGDFTAAVDTVRVLTLEVRKDDTTNIVGSEKYVGLMKTGTVPNYKYFISAVKDNAADCTTDACSNEILASNNDTRSFSLVGQDIMDGFASHTSATGSTDTLSLVMHVVDGSTSVANSGTAKTVTRYKVDVTASETLPTPTSESGNLFTINGGLLVQTLRHTFFLVSQQM